jgi:hypothetical protein
MTMSADLLIDQIDSPLPFPVNCIYTKCYWYVLNAAVGNDAAVAGYVDKQE